LAYTSVAAVPVGSRRDPDSATLEYERAVAAGVGIEKKMIST
jgi:hypothetical protein